jgi:hypothetical protein
MLFQKLAKNGNLSSISNGFPKEKVYFEKFKISQ